MENKIIEKDFGDLALNMGPQHPSTHGVFRLKLHLEGERINRVESYLGYLHRGVEKLSENLDYDMIPPVLERDDYLSPTSNSLGFINTIEDMCNIEVPKRASYLRVLIAEMQKELAYKVGRMFGETFERYLNDNNGAPTKTTVCFRASTIVPNFFFMLDGFNNK